MYTRKWTSRSAGIKRDSAPVGSIWTKQISTALDWIEVFLDGEPKHITRTFSVSSYMHKGDKIIVTIEASPWGISGILEVNDQIVSYFAEHLDAKVAQKLQIKRKKRARLQYR